MALPVNVRSIDVLRHFRAHLVRFGDDCKAALAAADMEISRMVDWLTNDRRLYWEAEIRRRREQHSQAKSDMHRKRTSQMFGQNASLSEQRDNLREALHRIEEAESKLERVRRWAGPLQQAILEYRGQARPLGDLIESDVPTALALLDRMIEALEDYASGSPTPKFRGTAPIPSAPAPAVPESTAD